MEKTGNNTIRVALFLIIAVLTVVLRLHTIAEPFTMDTAVYGYISHSLLGGQELYNGVWDHKPPGIYMLFALSELIWGYGPASIGYTGLIFTLISLVFLYQLVRRLAGAGPALACALLWALASNSVQLEANENNVEVFLNTFTIIAIWAYVRASGPRQGRFLLVSGISFALASLLKTIALFPLLSLAFYSLISLRQTSTDKTALNKLALYLKALAPLFVPGALLWGAVFLYFAVLGRFWPFFETVFIFNAHYSGSLTLNVWRFITSPSALVPHAYLDVALLALSAMLWIFFSKKQYGPLRRSFFVLLAIGLVVELASPGRYFNHYYQLLLPLFCILSALFYADIWNYLSVRKVSPRWLALLPVVLTIGYLSWYQGSYLLMSSDEISFIKNGDAAIDIVKIAKYIEGETAPCDTIYVWGGEAGYYYYSKRASASGIFFIFPLYFDTPERREQKIRRIYNDIISAPPALFIRSIGYGTLGESALFDFVALRYRLIKRFKGIEIYELKNRKSKTRGDCVASGAF